LWCTGYRALNAIVENRDTRVVRKAAAPLAGYGNYRRVTGCNSETTHHVWTKRIFSSDKELLAGGVSDNIISANSGSAVEVDVKCRPIVRLG
jgi:hypothetical protein